jgi:hypothetical protein
MDGLVLRLWTAPEECYGPARHAPVSNNASGIVAMAEYLNDGEDGHNDKK